MSKLSEKDEQHFRMIMLRTRWKGERQDKQLKNALIKLMEKQYSKRLPQYLQDAIDAEISRLKGERK